MGSPASHKSTNRNILILVGPTASGKTAVSLHLANRLGGEIISADSRQIYKRLDIGTAKPSREFRHLVVHHFVDELEPDALFSAGVFATQGRAVINELLANGVVPIVVGGSGLYVRALVDGLFEGPGADVQLRELLERRVTAGQASDLIEELRRVDPITAASADPTKPRRIIRALEVFYSTGKPISQHHREQETVVPFTPVFFGLMWERAALYRRIEQRCDEMLDQGLMAEVETLERLGYDDRLNALNTVGYAEAFAYRRGEISHDEMVRLFKQNSRRYAKRQLTWFRRDERITWLSMDERSAPEDVAEAIVRRFSPREATGGNGENR